MGKHSSVCDFCRHLWLLRSSTADTSCNAGIFRHQLHFSRNKVQSECQQIHEQMLLGMGLVPWVVADSNASDVIALGTTGTSPLGSMAKMISNSKSLLLPELQHFLVRATVETY